MRSSHERIGDSPGKLIERARKKDEGAIYAYLGSSFRNNDAGGGSWYYFGKDGGSRSIGETRVADTEGNRRESSATWMQRPRRNAIPCPLTAGRSIATENLFSTAIVPLFHFLSPRIPVSALLLPDVTERDRAGNNDV